MNTAGEEKQRTCAERWKEHKTSRVEDLRKLWDLYQSGDEDGDPELGTFHEYGLCFDYVQPGTFGDNQQEGYWRYQISCGGPQEEFRFYASSPEDPCYRISFVFLDWFDGEERELCDDDLDLMEDIWSFFQEVESARHEYDKARR